MSKNNVIEIDAVVDEILSGGKYKVKLEQGHTVVAKVSGKMRINSIRVIVGDKVKIEVSPYDLSQGRIVYRSK
jgi:translation initiation factor IF-1